MDTRPLALALLALALGSSAGCTATTAGDTEPFDPRPAAARTEPAARGPAAHRGRIAQGLTLEEARRLAVEANPTVASAIDAVNAARARIAEASVFSNPVLGVTKSDLSVRTGPNPGDSAPRVHAWDLRGGGASFSLQKDLDLSGKRIARTDAALESERQTEAQYAASLLQLRAQVRIAYAGVLIAERNRELVREAKDMAARTLAEVSARAGAGKTLPADELRAEADLARAENDVDAAERDLDRCRRALVTLLGDPDATLGPLRGDLPLAGGPDAAEDDAKALAEALEHNADVLAARRAVRAAEASVRLQERSAIPDLTLQLQYNRYFLDKQDTLGLGLGLPLPVFDRNRGQVAEAVALLHQAEHQLRATEQTVTQGVGDALRALRASRARLARLQERIVPGDRKAVALVESSYELGKTSYLDVVAARAAFNQARADYVNELLVHESALAELERLIPRPIHDD